MVITGIITGHATEKVALEARIVSLEEAVRMRDRLIASLQAIIENVKAAIRYLYGLLLPNCDAMHVRLAMRHCIAGYLTDALEGKALVVITRSYEWRGESPLRI